MTEADFDVESVLRFFMTNFDVEDEDNKIGRQTIFSSKGCNHALQHIPAADATALSQLQDACNSVVSMHNPKAAIFVASFMRLSGHIVHHLSCKECVRETVLEAVMEIAIRRDCFNLYTRETVLKAAMESAMFTNRQRERLMERLAKTWGDAIWSTENGIWNCPLDYFKTFQKGDGGTNNPTTQSDGVPNGPSQQPNGQNPSATDRLKLNLSADEGLDTASGESPFTDEDSEGYIYSSHESDREVCGAV